MFDAPNISIRAINLLQQDINKHKRDEIIAARYTPQPNSTDARNEMNKREIRTGEKEKLIIAIITDVLGDIRIF